MAAWSRPGPSCPGCAAKGAAVPPPPLRASSPFPLPFPICHPSHATLFLFGGGGSAWMLLSPSFHLLPFSSTQASLSATPLPVEREPLGKLHAGGCRGTAWHHRVCSRPLSERVLDLSLYFAKPESWDCLAQAPGAFQILIGLGCLCKEGTGREIGRLVQGIKGDTLFSGKKKFPVPTMVHQEIKEDR